MVLPIIYRKNPGIDVRYDWQDFATGNGYIKFYGACSVIAGPTRVYFLTTETLDSSTGDGMGEGVWTDNNMAGSSLDIDFDVTMNVPADVAAGIAYVELSIKMWDDDFGTSSATIYHVTPGGVETSLGTATHCIEEGTATEVPFRDLLKISTTAKHFAVGDRLRLTIGVAFNDNGRLYHDPSSALTFVDIRGRTIGTDLSVSIPFKVNN